jgi:hypothetical protein
VEHRLKVFENRVLKKTSESKRDEIVGGWRKFNVEELNNSFSSLSINIMIKSWRMRWAGHITRTGEEDCM